MSFSSWSSSSSGASHSLTESSILSSAALSATTKSKGATKSIADTTDGGVVNRKLRALPQFKDCDGEKLTVKINQLANPQEILYEFSHLLEREVINPVASDTAGQVSTRQVASIPLRIAVHDSEDHSRTTMHSVSEVFTENYHGSKGISLIVGNVVLYWGPESLVIPARDNNYPLSEAKTVELVGDSDKKDIFKALAELISRYNTRNIYHHSSRNAQGFVVEALKCLGINKDTAIQDGKPISVVL